MRSFVWISLTLLAVSLHLSGQSNGTEEKPCRIVRKGVTLPCPSGWSVLTENEDEAVVANFRLGPGVTKDTRSGQGKATMAVSAMPKLYRNFSEWIYAAHKNAPDAVERKLEVTSVTGSKIPVIHMVPPDSRGPIYSSFFLQAGPTPLLIELMYRADDPKRDDYEASVRSMIGSVSSTALKPTSLYVNCLRARFPRRMAPT